ncbi:type II toxin-antitoxin system RelE/ParE family toxin [Geomonas oryzae]|uniref:type II toxin-antitoxin system RelE/ParE family toxin n=1 Tax=Geomonas oryzae TaxID=2364273 RepID=UPI00100BF510|nr:type II toxin-antitoxin system RelE/ParE family toxin [Geomonas oryzae]
MIISFKDKEAEKLFNGKFSAKLPQDIQRTAATKLAILHAVTALETLRAPPSNYLEALRGDRQGQYSIRINRQWRICFTWDEGNAADVEIVDYH